MAQAQARDLICRATTSLRSDGLLVISILSSLSFRPKGGICISVDIHRLIIKVERAEDMSTDRVFLKAEWRNLAMLNYEVDPGVLSEFIPAGTELDRWNGKLFVSLVGFQFLKTRVLGFSIPFHRNFDEVNLRFYVRRSEGGEDRRGVVFIKEIVPRRAIAFIARNVYNERYVALPMRHRIESTDLNQEVEYGWRCEGKWIAIKLRTEGIPALPQENSEEQFITEHYWGYAQQHDGNSMEYRVAHPPWRVWRGCDAKFEGDMTELYGPVLAAVVRGKPSSAFLAEGSEVTVFLGRKIQGDAR